MIKKRKQINARAACRDENEHCLITLIQLAVHPYGNLQLLGLIHSMLNIHTNIMPLQSIVQTALKLI